MQSETASKCRAGQGRAKQAWVGQGRWRRVGRGLTMGTGTGLFWFKRPWLLEDAYTVYAKNVARITSCGEG